MRRVTYYRCQSCKENVHCYACEKSVLALLADEPEITNVQLNLTTKEMSFVTTLDECDLNDALEDVGIYLV